MKRLIIIIILIALAIVLYIGISGNSMKNLINKASDLSQMTTETVNNIKDTYGKDAAEKAASLYAKYGDIVTAEIAEFYGTGKEATRNAIETAADSISRTDFNKITADIKDFTEDEVQSVLTTAVNYGTEAALKAKDIIKEKGLEGLAYIKSEEFTSQFN